MFPPFTTLPFLLLIAQLQSIASDDVDVNCFQSAIGRNTTKGVTPAEIITTATKTSVTKTTATRTTATKSAADKASWRSAKVTIVEFQERRDFHSGLNEYKEKSQRR